MVFVLAWMIPPLLFVIVAFWASFKFIALELVALIVPEFLIINRPVSESAAWIALEFVAETVAPDSTTIVVFAWLFVLMELADLSRVKDLITVTSVLSPLIFCCSSVFSATSLPDPVIFSA